MQYNVVYEGTPDLDRRQVCGLTIFLTSQRHPARSQLLNTSHECAFERSKNGVEAHRSGLIIQFAVVCQILFSTTQIWPMLSNDEVWRERKNNNQFYLFFYFLLFALLHHICRNIQGQTLLFHKSISSININQITSFGK